MHLGSGQVEAWQPAAQKKRCSPAVLPTLPGAAAERSLAVEARFRSMTRAPERRSRRNGNAKIADNQVQMLLTLQRVFCRRRPILRGHGRTGMIRFWIDLFSGTQILDPQVLVLRTRVRSSSDSASRICSALSSRWNSRSLIAASSADPKDVPALRSKFLCSLYSPDTRCFLRPESPLLRLGCYPVHAIAAGGLKCAVSLVLRERSGDMKN